MSTLCRAGEHPKIYMVQELRQLRQQYLGFVPQEMPVTLARLSLCSAPDGVSLRRDLDIFGCDFVLMSFLF